MSTRMSLSGKACSRQRPVTDALRKRFGDAVLGPSGSVDRVTLAEIVFSDDSERLWLEELTHPVYFEILRELLRSGTPRQSGSSRYPSCSRSRSRIGLISRSAWRVIPLRNSLAWSSAVWTARSPGNAYPSNCRWLGRSSCPISSFGMTVQPDFLKAQVDRIVDSLNRTKAGAPLLETPDVPSPQDRRRNVRSRRRCRVGKARQARPAAHPQAGRGVRRRPRGGAGRDFRPGAQARAGAAPPQRRLPTGARCRRWRPGRGAITAPRRATAARPRAGATATGRTAIPGSATSASAGRHGGQWQPGPGGAAPRTRQQPPPPCAGAGVRGPSRPRPVRGPGRRSTRSRRRSPPARASRSTSTTSTRSTWPT